MWFEEVITQRYIHIPPMEFLFNYAFKFLSVTYQNLQEKVVYFVFILLALVS